MYTFLDGTASYTWIIFPGSLKTLEHMFPNKNNKFNYDDYDNVRRKENL